MSNLISLKNEHINIINKVNNYNDPEKIYIPVKFLEKNIKLKEYVYKNTYFKNYISSISGYVSGVENIMFNKKKQDCIILENDYKENVENKNKSINIKNVEDLLNVLEKYKLDGIKSKIENIKDIQNLILLQLMKNIIQLKNIFV